MSRTHVLSLVLLSLSAAMVSSACDDDDPCLPEYRLQSGTGTAQGSNHLLLGPEDKTIVVDQADSMITIRYVRMGEEVVETWKLSLPQP